MQVLLEAIKDHNRSLARVMDSEKSVEIIHDFVLLEAARLCVDRAPPMSRSMPRKWHVPLKNLYGRDG